MTGFAAADLTQNGFLGNRLRLWQPRVGYRAAIDPVLLAAFAPARPGDAALDLGCGAGTVALCLGARVAGLDLHGLEIQPAYADLARRNAAANGIGMTVHEGDLRRPPADLRARSFDIVVANPPFHPGAAATAARDPGRDVAQREGDATLGDWIAAGLRRLRPGGAIVLIHLPARLSGILAAIDGPAGGIEILPVTPRPGAPASRVLVRAGKGRRRPLVVHAPLVLHGPARDGAGYADRAEAVLRGDSGLDADAT